MPKPTIIYLDPSVARMLHGKSSLNSQANPDEEQPPWPVDRDVATRWVPKIEQRMLNLQANLQTIYHNSWAWDKMIRQDIKKWTPSWQEQVQKKIGLLGLPKKPTFFLSSYGGGRCLRVPWIEK